MLTTALHLPPLSWSSHPVNIDKAKNDKCETPVPEKKTPYFGHVATSCSQAAIVKKLAELITKISGYISILFITDKPLSTTEVPRSQ